MKSTDQKVSMADLMDEVDAQMRGYRGGFNPGEPVRGRVISVGSEYLVIDIHAKIEGVIPREDLDPDEPLPQEGDMLDLFFVQMQGGAARLSQRLGGSAMVVEQSIRHAFETGMPLEGVIEKEVNGGYEVSLAGQRAFCPYSQTGIFRPEEGEETDLVGRRLPFLVIEFDPGQKTLVVSHREVLEQERAQRREQLMEELREGDMREGVVTRLMPFGAFVDLGGIEGLIPLRELTWDRTLKPEDCVSPGQTVTVLILSLDWENDRFGLSLRGVSRDPWLDFADEYEPGQYLTVTVTQLLPFGAFVQIEPGVEGLIPISRLGAGRRLSHPSEVLSEGDVLDVQIDTIDREKKRVSLKPADSRVEALTPGEIAVGATLKGFVESVKNYGIFVRLSEDKTGLLHVSECQVEPGGNTVGKLQAKFPPESVVEVRVKALDGNRISLALPGTEEEAVDIESSGYAPESPGKGKGTFGSLEDLFGSIKV